MRKRCATSKSNIRDIIARNVQLTTTIHISFYSSVREGIVGRGRTETHVDKALMKWANWLSASIAKVGAVNAREREFLKR